MSTPTSSTSRELSTPERRQVARSRLAGAVAGKDLKVLWSSPIPWVAGAMFHVALGLLYVNELQDRRQALIQPLFPLAGFLLVVVAPLLTMRALAEEAGSGTLDVLRAVPVPAGPLVVGKWLAAWLTSLAVLAPAGLAVLVLALFGSPDYGPVVAGFVGLVLLAGAVTAVGVLASSFTASQPVAAVAALFVTLLLWFANKGADAAVAGTFLNRLSLSDRLRGFASGLLDSGDAGFFVVASLIALVLAAFVVDSRTLR